MGNDKLKLPTTIPATIDPSTLPESVQRAVLRTQRANIEAGAKVEVARLQVAQEAIAATRAFFDVLRSANELEATRVEWEGRVKTAEEAVKKAEADLKVAAENNRPRLVELEQSKAALDHFLKLFDEVMREASAPDLSPEVKAAHRQYLLNLGDQIVKLRA